MSTALRYDRLEELIAHYAHARRTLPGPIYTTILEWIHRALMPATYVEIGVQNGNSMIRAGSETICIGIDPAPALKAPLPANVRLFELTSDEFFASHNLRDLLGGRDFSLAFIDGLHLYEQALRDFLNIEKFASPQSIVLLHDCIPLDAVTADRTRSTDFYSGDVWKLALCLKEQRPDLQMLTIPTTPTGLCVVSGLNRASTAERHFDDWVARYIGLTFQDYQMRAAQMPPQIPNTREAVTALVADLLRRPA